MAHITTYSQDIKRIIIDPGHGGSDPGTNIGKLFEKNITLEVALQLGQYFDSYLPGVTLFYTRTKDVNVSLAKRSQMSNKKKADLVISIHINSAPIKSIIGAETYVYGNPLRTLISNEHDVYTIELENNAHTNEKKLLKSLPSRKSKPHTSLSNLIAARLQNQYATRMYRVNRGVKFTKKLYMINATQAPTVLTELGFLTNKKERKFLKTHTAKTYYASAIYRAIRDHLYENKYVNKYTVQLALLSKKVKLTDKKWKSAPHVEMEEVNGKYLYTKVFYANKKTAKKVLTKIHKSGIRDAFFSKIE